MWDCDPACRHAEANAPGKEQQATTYLQQLMDESDNKIAAVVDRILSRGLKSHGLSFIPGLKITGLKDNRLFFVKYLSVWVKVKNWRVDY